MKKMMLTLLVLGTAMAATGAQKTDGYQQLDEITVTGYAPVDMQDNSNAQLMDELTVNGYLLNTQKKGKEDPIFEVVEVQPEYPGGQSALMKYLCDNIKYPARAQKNKKQGRVIVQFVVEKSGEPSHFKLVRAVDPDLDAEALRVVKSIQKFKPGMQKGKPVRVRFCLPISFRLQ